jgi:hypothetical protein
LNVPKSMDLEAWTSIIQGCRNKIKTFEHTLGKIRGLTVEHRSKDTFSLYTFFPKKGPGSRKGINCLARMEESIVPGMYLPIGSNEDGDILLGLSRISIPLFTVSGPRNSLDTKGLTVKAFQKEWVTSNSQVAVDFAKYVRQHKKKFSKLRKKIVWPPVVILWGAGQRHFFDVHKGIVEWQTWVDVSVPGMSYYDWRDYLAMDLFEH